MRGQALRAYCAVAAVSGPVWRWAVGRRVAQGREDAGRVAERWGTTAVARPEGVLLWVHALGLGEALAALAVIRGVQAARPDVAVLLTTGTRAGADGLARAGLPDGVIHLYAPVDAPGPVTAFLGHWRPDALLLAELDLWPLMLSQLAVRRVPLVMANVRLTDRRFAGRMRMRALMRDVLALFDAVLVQDDLTAARMAALGADPARVQVAGLLKAAAAPLPDQPGPRAALAAQIGGRPVWLAAATEAREVAAVLAAHAQVRAAVPGAALIVAPRQMGDAQAVADQAVAAFGAVARRSLGQGPQGAVYLADTVGEMGLWYRLAGVSFIGHSLGAGLTGKNPFEAVALGSAVIHGGGTGNFAESYDVLGRACVQVADAQELAGAVIRLLRDPGAAAAMAARAQAALLAAQVALPLTIRAVLCRLPPVP